MNFTLKTDKNGGKSYISVFKNYNFKGQHSDCRKKKKSSEMCQKSNKNVSTVLNSQKCNMRSFTFDLKQKYGTTSKNFYYANIILSK